MSNSDYKIISKTDGIVMKKKNSKYKLEFETEIKSYDKFIEIIKRNKFYDLLYMLNKDIIESQKSEIISDTELNSLFLISIVESDEYDEFDKYYIKFNSHIEILESKSSFSASFKGKTIDYSHPDYVPIEIDDLKTKILIDKKKSSLEVILSFKFVEKKIPSHIEKSISLFFNKVLHRLKKYLNSE